MNPSDAFHRDFFYSLVVNFTQNFDHVDIFREFAVPHFGDRIEARVISMWLKALFMHSVIDWPSIRNPRFSHFGSVLCMKGSFGAVCVILPTST